MDDRLPATAAGDCKGHSKVIVVSSYQLRLSKTLEIIRFISSRGRYVGPWAEVVEHRLARL
eukprot:scaffold606586_cov22-Prasinocladus_malaysianus.AAC.1